MEKNLASVSALADMESDSEEGELIITGVCITGVANAAARQARTQEHGESNSTSFLNAREHALASDAHWRAVLLTPTLTHHTAPAITRVDDPVAVVDVDK